jgi:hypothetical protein
MIAFKDTRIVCMLALLPGLFWRGGPDTAPALRQAGIESFTAPPEQLTAWKSAGFTVKPLSEEALRGRVKLMPPGINRKVMVASATTAPWVDANGWRMRREPNREFWYDLPAGTAPLAAAEAFAFDANVLLKVDPADLDRLGKMLQFLRSVPERTLPEVVDFGFIDDGSEHANEFLNLLSRRNLLYRVVRTADPRLKLNVAPGSDDPRLFAAKVREQLKDDQRSLRVYGSEVVLCRLTADGAHARIHVLNYGRNTLEGIRLRVRGSYAHGKLYAATATKPIEDYVSADGFTEFSIPELGVYAVVDLER